MSRARSQLVIDQELKILRQGAILLIIRLYQQRGHWRAFC
jgi:hypothetical protein